MRSWIGDRRERIQQGEKSVKGGGGGINLHRRMNLIIAKVKEKQCKVKSVNGSFCSDH